jgi:hypothetical protein
LRNCRRRCDYRANGHRAKECTLRQVSHGLSPLLRKYSDMSLDCFWCTTTWHCFRGTAYTALTIEYIWLHFFVKSFYLSRVIAFLADNDLGMPTVNGLFLGRAAIHDVVLKDARHDLLASWAGMHFLKQRANAKRKT